MDTDREDDDRASRGRRIFEALRRRPEDEQVDDAAEQSGGVTTMEEAPGVTAPGAEGNGGTVPDRDPPAPEQPGGTPEAARPAAPDDDQPSPGATAEESSIDEATTEAASPPPDPEPVPPEVEPAPEGEAHPEEAGVDTPQPDEPDEPEKPDEPDTRPTRVEGDRRPLPGASSLESELAAPPAPAAAAPAPPPAPVRSDPAPPPAEEAQPADAASSADEAPPERLSLPRVLAIANQKGGVGKTTTAVNLGAALAERDFRVLIVDLDPQGNATTGVGIDIRNLAGTLYESLMSDSPLEDCVEPTSVRNLFIAPSNMELAGAEIELVPMFSRELKLRRAIDAVKPDYDFVLIDCPPSLGLLTVNGLAAADDVIVPIQCEYYALEGVGQLVNNVNLVRANLNPVLDIRGIVLTMYDARTKLADQVVDEVRSHFGNKVFKTVVPRTVRLSEAPSFGQPIIVFDASSRGADAYRALAEELADRVEPRSDTGNPQEPTGSPTG